jgi:hypothetical protein
MISCDHTQAHTTVGTTPLDKGPARRRDLYLTTQTLYKTNFHASGGIRTHDPSKRSTADLRLRPTGHWDRPIGVSKDFNPSTFSPRRLLDPADDGTKFLRKVDKYLLGNMA